MNASNPPELSPGPDTDYPMSDHQIQQWIDACNHEPAKEVLREYLKLRTRSAPACAEGWQLVPKEPTVDMTAAAYVNQPNVINGGFAQAYRVMLAASPPPPSADGVEG